MSSWARRPRARRGITTLVLTLALLTLVLLAGGLEYSFGDPNLGKRRTLFVPTPVATPKTGPASPTSLPPAPISVVATPSPTVSSTPWTPLPVATGSESPLPTALSSATPWSAQDYAGHWLDEDGKEAVVEASRTGLQVHYEDQDREFHPEDQGFVWDVSEGENYVGISHEGDGIGWHRYVGGEITSKHLHRK